MLHAADTSSHSPLLPCRVLLFLEALALGQEPPSFGLHLCPPLLAAARWLGLRPLEVPAGRWGGRAGLRCCGCHDPTWVAMLSLPAAGGRLLNRTCWTALCLLFN